MYLKNKSDIYTVTLKTTNGLIGFKPGEVFEVNPRTILTKINSMLVEVDSLEPVEEVKNDVPQINEIQPVVKPEQPIQEKTEEVPVAQDKPKKNNKVKKEEKSEEPVKDTLINETNAKSFKVEPITTEETVDTLQKHIEDLKVTWQKTRRPKQKEVIAKEIEELKAKISKLKGEN